MNENTNWYVVYTLPRWEKKVAKMLTDKRVENYCPLNKVQKQWSDRKKIVWEPLFKGYVFLKIEDAKKWKMKSNPGIINFVYWLGKPAVVREEEINTIKKFMEEFDHVDVFDTKLETQDRVVVQTGTFMDYKGIVLELVGGNKARVLIESLGVCLVALFDKKSLALDNNK